MAAWTFLFGENVTGGGILPVGVKVGADLGRNDEERGDSGKEEVHLESLRVLLASDLASLAVSLGWSLGKKKRLGFAMDDRGM